MMRIAALGTRAERNRAARAWLGVRALLGVALLGTAGCRLDGCGSGDNIDLVPVSIHVVDAATGKDLPGATVTVSSCCHQEAYTIPADGRPSRFTPEMRDGGEYTIRVERAGYVAATRTVTVPVKCGKVVPQWVEVRLTSVAPGRWY